MKKIFAIGLITIASLLAVSAAFADEGEAEEQSNVAPALIQEPSATARRAAPAVSAAQPQTQWVSPMGTPAAAGKRVIREASLRTADSQVLDGTLVCVTPSGLMQPKSKVVVADASGAQCEFTMKVLGVIYDSKGTILAVDQLAQGDKVQVSYRMTSSNTREATSIKVIR